MLISQRNGHSYELHATSRSIGIIGI
jgi:hypothetical protein